MRKFAVAVIGSTLILASSAAGAATWTFQLSYLNGGGFNGPGGPVSFSGTFDASTLAGDGNYILDAISGTGTDARYGPSILMITGLSSGGNASRVRLDHDCTYPEWRM